VPILAATSVSALLERAEEGLEQLESALLGRLAQEYQERYGADRPDNQA